VLGRRWHRRRDEKFFTDTGLKREGRKRAQFGLLPPRIELSHDLFKIL